MSHKEYYELDQEGSKVKTLCETTIGIQTIIWRIWCSANTFLDVTSNNPLSQERVSREWRRKKKIWAEYIPGSRVCSFLLYVENQGLQPMNQKKQRS